MRNKLFFGFCIAAFSALTIMPSVQPDTPYSPANFSRCNQVFGANSVNAAEWNMERPRENQDPALINQGKYAWGENFRALLEIRKVKGKNNWKVTVPSYGSISGENGKEFFQDTTDLDCFQNGNRIVCPFTEKGDDSDRVCVQEYGNRCGLTLTQVDKDTIEAVTVGDNILSGSGQGVSIPAGICKKK